MLTHISGFIEDAGYQAESRERIALEYPDDARNGRSADALHELADWLNGLPADAEILSRLNAVLEALYSDPDIMATFIPGVTDRLARYEFFNRPLKEYDHEGFVEGLIMEIGEHIQTRMIAEPTERGKQKKSTGTIHQIAYDPDDPEKRGQVAQVILKWRTEEQIGDDWTFVVNYEAYLFSENDLEAIKDVIGAYLEQHPEIEIKQFDVREENERYIFEGTAKEPADA